MTEYLYSFTLYLVNTTWDFLKLLTNLKSHYSHCPWVNLCPYIMFSFYCKGTIKHVDWISAYCINYFSYCFRASAENEHNDTINSNKELKNLPSPSLWSKKPMWSMSMWLYLGFETEISLQQKINGIKLTACKIYYDFKICIKHYWKYHLYSIVSCINKY